MHKVSHTLHVNVPPEQVWDYLADPSNFPEWSSTAHSSEHLGEGPVKLGSRVKEVRNLLGVQMESVYEVTEHDRPRTLGTKVLEGPVPFEFKWTLEPAHGGTRLTGEGVSDAEWAGGHEDHVVEAATQKNLQHDMETIKHLLEAR